MQLEVLEQDVLSLKEAAHHLDVPEEVLKNWVAWRFRAIPCHFVGSGKKTGICFFKEEIESWFDRNGGRFLSKQVMEKKDSRFKKYDKHRS